MGGKNHQPCRMYLHNSTRLSRAMSAALVELELANIALEDIILSELDHERGEVKTILTHLEQSEHALRQMQTAAGDLRQQMKEESFEDLPTLKTMNLVDFGHNCMSDGLHRDPAQFDIATHAYNNGGFAQALELIEQRIAHIMKLTSKLTQAVDNAGVLAETGSLTAALEENTSANFRTEFAELYTAWANFQQFFLASALISTELWYQFNRTGTILKSSPAVKVA